MQLLMKILGKINVNLYFNFRIFFFSSEYLIRVNTEPQFTFPLVRIKLIQDSALNVGSNIQGYISYLRYI